MRKKIEVKGKEVKEFNLNEKENAMEIKVMEYYKKKMKRISYLKDRDTTEKLMDYQDAVNEAFTSFLGSKTEIENVNYYFGKAISNNFRHRHIGAPIFENFGITLSDTILEDNNEIIEVGAIQLPTGEIATVLQAIKKCLSPIEFFIFEKYNIEDKSLESIASSLGSNKMEISRRYKRIVDKVDKLKVSYFYESRYAAYQGKIGKVNAPYDSEVKYNEKLDRYEKVVYAQSEIVNRQYACLDQVKPSNRVPKNYQGDMVVIKKQKKMQTLPDTRGYNEIKFYYKSTQYDDSTLPPFTTNAELLLLIKNKVEYSRYIKSISTVVKENRNAPYFSYGKYISQDGKYLNI